jgi:transcriptional regulator with XRE-family HTH domain
MVSGAEIRAARLAKGWTQTDLAEELDVVLETVNRWETGVYQPPRRSEIALRTVLGIRPAINKDNLEHYVQVLSPVAKRAKKAKGKKR